MNTISVADLRRDLSGVLDAVETGEPVTITRHGRPVAILGPVDVPAEGLGGGSIVSESRAAYDITTECSVPAPAVRRDQWNDRLFASAGVRRVLSLFVLQPERVFYQREVARSADVPLRSAQLALDRLERLELIAAVRSGNRMHYQAVRSPAFDALREWAMSEVALVPLLREALAPLGSAIEMAFVYGSTASGADTAASDIDLMIVGVVDTYRVIEALEPVRERVGREINVSRYAPEEFRRKSAEGSHFMTTVMKGPVLWVLGVREAGHDS